MHQVKVKKRFQCSDGVLIAFKAKPLSHHSFTEFECRDLLKEYIEYIWSLKIWIPEPLVFTPIRPLVQCVPGIADWSHIIFSVTRDICAYIESYRMNPSNIESIKVISMLYREKSYLRDLEAKGVTFYEGYPLSICKINDYESPREWIKTSVIVTFI